MNGTVLDIMRLSTEDGPGVRTTVFLKGCTLSCEWCHNVESIGFEAQPLWLRGRCMGCLSCHSACKSRALYGKGGNIIIDRALCKSCLQCAAACPTGALEKKGKQYSAVALATELLKDRAYFGSQGGVTLSGGEPLAQSGFVKELLCTLKSNGIHTALDTCGFVKWGAFEDVLPFTDLILFDLKIFDREAHKKFTGQYNDQILENAKSLCKAAGAETHIWVRTPIIPGATDSDENIKRIGEFIKNGMKTVQKWELCAFNNLCASKYESMGIDWRFKDTQLMEKQRMDELTQTGSDAWGRQAVWSGATRLQ